MLGARDTVVYSADIFDDGSSSNALQVGRYAGGSQYLDGTLDEVLIYKRSLNAGEVSWLYNAGNGRTYADLSAGSPTTYTYNASHKHAVASLSTGETYTYDANGNMTQRVEGGLTYTQTFDAENRLISVSVNSQTTQFVYDGDGNLVKKIYPDNSKTIYVGSVYEVDKSAGGSITSTTTYYPAGGAMRVDETLYYILKDHLGSASTTTDSNGNIVGEQRYYPFGETRLTTGGILTDRLFTGQREMTGLGIYHYNARYYSPKLGRFIQPDTIVPGVENPQAWNRYSYVFNNPIKDTDPSGHCPTASCGGSLGGMVNIHVSPFQPPRETGTVNINVSGPNIFSPVIGPLVLINGFEQPSNQPKILFSKNKKEKSWLDWLLGKLDIDEDEREEVHQQMRRNRLTKKEIEDEFREIKRVKDKKKNEKKKDKKD